MKLQTVHDYEYHTAIIDGVWSIEVHKTEIALVQCLKETYGIDIKNFKHTSTRDHDKGMTMYTWEEVQHA